MTNTVTNSLVTVRDATAADLDAIFAIYDEQVLHGTATFDTQPKTPAQRLEWLNAHPADMYPALVAECEGVIAGWGTLSRWSDRCAYSRTAEDSVYVHTAFRGRGIGRRLLAEIIERAKRGGVRVVVARIVVGNPASVKLHESLGFQSVGTMRRVGEKFGRVLDVLIMDRHLEDEV